VSIRTALAPPLSLRHWLGLPPERLRPVRHFIGIAITLAAAKVFLNTLGFALFLANEGPSRLPQFYLLLAVVAIALSSVLGRVVDRAPKLQLARATLIAIMAIAGAGKLMIAVDLPGSYFVILSSAYIFEIAIEILLWATCAAYLDTVELKRATPLICLGIALGGALGGLLARTLAGGVAPPDLLLLMLIFAGLCGFQFARLAELDELPDRAAEPDDDPRGHTSSFARMALRYPFLVLVSLNALVLTILYGISEFLFLSVYSQHYPEERELTRFLGIVFALLQTCEFLLLVSLSRVLLERASPLWRNLVFPLTSLACLLYLSLSDRLHAAVITHLNAEAGSNAIFQPVHNANFLALPLGIQGRARTLSEGVFYPAGLAVAGALLWSLDSAGIVAAAESVAVVVALGFILLNVGIGVLFLPTLIASLRSGIVPLADLSARIVGLPASAADRVREFLHSPVPELRLDGIALCRWLGPERLGDELCALASHPDAATRRALVGLASEAEERFARRFVEATYRRGERAAKVAAQVMLARRQAPSAEHLAALCRADDPSVAALACLLEGDDPRGTRARIAPMLTHPQVAADVVDAIVGTRRADLAELLVAALPAAPADQQRLGLEFVRRARPRPTAPSAWRTLGRFVRHADPAVRADAMAVLGGCPHRAPRRALARGLADRSPRVRGRAADALGAHGDAAVALLSGRLVPVTLGSVEAARALGGIDTEPARRALAGALRRLRRDAQDSARLLDRLGAAPDREPWAGLVTCARDHQARAVELALAALSPALPRHVLGHVRDALRAQDRRRRANAFEVLAALGRSGPVSEALETLRVVLFGTAFDALPAGQDRRFDAHAAVTVARASRDSWLRAAARRAERRLTPRAVPGLSPDHESHAMIPNEQDLERVLTLKRIALFRYLPLDTLLAIAHSVQSRRYAPGEVIAEAGARLEHCHILEAGVVAIERAGTTESLAAPASFNELVLIGEATPAGRIVAREPCRVLRLHAVVFQDLGRDHPEILVELCRILARRVRAAEAAVVAAPRPVDPVQHETT